ncbi:related to Elongator complex protein 6 [Saccharomycodes ludwigii]|uniref:Related to Elongator complex protein 6 n=1 Tax=Saccharomycodes ludwigii TaxID=36035 RepID=A0A376B7R4_9ASCO|nr:hypothetical protein SCDLUD_004433 [Saccharomycodes ludwigii]KAH3899012.1 hypothetical protein SCDLUD_004433 [Saccharomycodes ludwigii]SSD60661.1 related to Elongator complex protein 6 [Saccharomycodes ludwigii]
MVQKQDLVIFNDRTVLPDFKNHGHTLTHITHKLGTSPTWLLTALIETHIHGVPLSLNESEKSNGKIPIVNKSPIYISSFIHNESYSEQHFQNKISPQSGYYILPNLMEEIMKCTINTHNNGNNFDGLCSYILKMLKVKKEEQEQQTTIILEEPQLLLALIPNLKARDILLKLITPISQIFQRVIVVTNIELYDNDATAESIEIKKFIQTIFYRSIVQLSLKPLETGRANDVTGTLRITRGGCASAVDNTTFVVENEYLYHVQKKSIKLFYR